MRAEEEQVDMLRHMLGINDPSKPSPEPYRNYAAVERGDPLMARLVTLGLVQRYACAASELGGLHYYCCTSAGIAVAKTSFWRRRWTKPKRIYRRFLEVSNCDPDLSFKRFLTDPEFADIRKRA